jgi:hypothetical protein
MSGFPAKRGVRLYPLVRRPPAGDEMSCTENSYNWIRGNRRIREIQFLGVKSLTRFRFTTALADRPIKGVTKMGRVYKTIISECGKECPAFCEDGWNTAIHSCELHDEEMPAEMFQELALHGESFPDLCPLPVDRR